MTASRERLPVVLEYDPTENVYLAECTILPDCYTVGATYEEALANILDAIQLVIESRLAVGDPVPIQDYGTVTV